MQVVRGTSILKQNAIGKLHFLHRAFPEPAAATRLSREEEWERFCKAQQTGVLELAGLYDRAAQEVGSETAAIFAIHAMLLEDEDLSRMVREQIFDHGTSAEYAVWKTAVDVTAAFRNMDDPYMKARGADILDIAIHVLRLLRGEELGTAPDSPIILVADYFLPSEVMWANGNGKLRGVISRQGSTDSHTAMLLQAYHIPAFVDVELDEKWHGHPALLDGHAGVIYLDPDGETLKIHGLTTEFT